MRFSIGPRLAYRTCGPHVSGLYLSTGSKNRETKFSPCSRSFFTHAIGWLISKRRSPSIKTSSGSRKCGATPRPRGSQLVFFKAPESAEEIEICKFDESGPVQMGPDLTHLAFEVEDIAAFAKHAAAKGYPLSDGPTPDGQRQRNSFHRRAGGL